MKMQVGHFYILDFCCYCFVWLSRLCEWTMRNERTNERKKTNKKRNYFTCQALCVRQENSYLSFTIEYKNNVLEHRTGSFWMLELRKNRQKITAFSVRSNTQRHFGTSVVCGKNRKPGIEQTIADNMVIHLIWRIRL